MCVSAYSLSLSPSLSLSLSMSGLALRWYTFTCDHFYTFTAEHIDRHATQLESDSDKGSLHQSMRVSSEIKWKSVGVVFEWPLRGPECVWLGVCLVVS